MAMTGKSTRSFLANLWASLSREVGVEDVGAFEHVETEIGCALPADYKGFLMRTNGGETLEPFPRFRFYPLEELVVRRLDGQPPNVLEFGTDDSDGFAFDLARDRVTADYRVVRYPLGDRTREDVEEVAMNLVSFVDWLSRSK